METESETLSSLLWLGLLALEELLFLPSQGGVWDTCHHSEFYLGAGDQLWDLMLGIQSQNNEAIIHPQLHSLLANLTVVTPPFSHSGAHTQATGNHGSPLASHVLVIETPGSGGSVLETQEINPEASSQRV